MSNLTDSDRQLCANVGNKLFKHSLAAANLGAVLLKYYRASKSWHENHSHEPNGIHCDRFCDYMREAKSALTKAGLL